MATYLEWSQNKCQINHPHPRPSKLKCWSRSVKQVEIIGRLCPFLLFFDTSTKISKRFSGVTAPNLTLFVHDVATFNMLPSCPSAFRYYVLKWQCNNEDWCEKKRRFSDFNRLPWQRPLSDRQMNAGLIKPYLSTNHENLVKIRSIVPEMDLLLGRPLKYFFMK